ncbi:aminotransferase [Roseomonas sp. CCTCC AB2023176]|uniref:aminotransferase n=1 Tax=Roseomonas sp. CCTCC AB2023176 TaxID=3342640 RepID=UPI0035DCF792
MPPLSASLLDTASPPIPEVQAWGRAYDGSCGPLMNLCQAVPAYPPPNAMLRRLAEAAGEPASASYGPILGEPTLREAVAEELRLTLGGGEAENVAITAGCNQAFFVALTAIADAGDAVLIPTPWYFNHAMAARMTGIEPRPLPCRAENGFVPDVEEAARRMADGRVRAVVLVTPNNPTGAIYPPEVIAAFHALCRDRGAWLILDETYADFLPDGGRAHDLLAGGNWPEALIRLTSFSKSFAIPGHRLGALAAPASVLPEMTKVMDCVQICANRGAQAALTWGLAALDGWRAERRAEATRRAGRVREAFSRLDGWRLESVGVYFAYARHPFGAESAWRVCEHLAREHGMMALPGPAFGGEERHLRIAFANLSETDIPALESRLRAVATAAVPA